MSRFDWSPRGIALLQRVQKIPAQKEEELQKLLVECKHPEDVEFVFEIAACSGDTRLLKLVGEAMHQTGNMLHIETQLRIVLWPHFNSVREAPRLAEYVACEQPSCEKFVFVMLAAAAHSPFAFTRMLSLCPPIQLTQHAVGAIQSVCWDPWMAAAVSRSWIRDNYSELIRPLHLCDKLRSTDEIQNLILCAKLGYQKMVVNQTPLEMTVDSYCVSFTDDRCMVGDFNTREGSDTVVAVNKALNYFVNKAKKPASIAFHATKECKDPSHFMCRHLIKKNKDT